MNILMMTNTYTPHVGGVARSVESFTARDRQLGHRVLVVAPAFPDMPESELDVARIPALQNFNGSDFSVPLPLTPGLRRSLEQFQPDIVHSHHPFLLGDSALRIAAAQNVPIVFTHHTMYELYTHYVPGDSPRFRRFAVDLATGYCNLCDAVIAPSASVAEILHKRGVSVPIEVIPTGVNCEHFARGDGAGFRRAHGIPADAWLIGHVGRLAPEKNLEFLSRALAHYAQDDSRAWVLAVGGGPSGPQLEREFAQRGVSARLIRTGALGRDALPGAYRAMDTFAFSSHSETQGMVLTEALAAGVPVVALDAPGVREVVVDCSNGRLLESDDVGAFCEALRWVAELSGSRRSELASQIAQSARQFSIESTAERVLALYRRLIDERAPRQQLDPDSPWATARRMLAEEWKILAHRTGAVREAWTGGRAPSTS